MIMPKIHGLRKKLTPLNMLVAICILYLLFFVAYFIMLALTLATNMDSYPANGTFQIYNPLRRLSDGQFPGRDFPFFHGIGIAWLHFPLFVMLGEGVFAAEITKWFISPVIFLLSTFLVSYAFNRKQLAPTLITTAVITALCIAYVDAIFPGNSLLGLRSTMPIVIASALLLFPAKRSLTILGKNILLKPIFISALLALSIFMGTEQGIAACIAFMIVLFVTKWRLKFSNIKPAALASLLYIGLIIFFTIIFASLFTGGHPLSALHYAFIDIPKDQGWYFGAPPNPYLTWDNLIPYLFDVKHNMPIMITGLIFSFILLAGAYKKNLLSGSETKVFLFLILTTLIVFVAGVMGYYAPNAQLIPMFRVSAIIIAVVVIRIFIDLTNNVLRDNDQKAIRFLITCSMLLMLVLLGLKTLPGLYNAYRNFEVRSTLKKSLEAPSRNDEFVAGPLWQQRLKDLSSKIDPSKELWSTYTSLYDSTNKSLNPSPGGEDYIIHALGDSRRDAYEDKFLSLRPEQVITLKANYFPYEEWLWSRHWKVYGELFSNYEIVSESTSHLLWERRAQNEQKESWIKFDGLNKSSFTLPTNNSSLPKIYEVRLSYVAKSGLPLNGLSNIPRYMVDIENASAMQYSVALPQYKNEWIFPIVVMPGESNVKIRKNVGGILSSAELSIKSSYFRERSVLPLNTYALMGNYCLKPEHYPSDERCRDEILQLSRYLK